MDRKISDNTVLRFVLVGMVNTMVGMAIMFGLYNLVHCSYWMSSACNYILTSVLSFFLNKYFTFQNKGKIAVQAVRFAVNIVVCYLMAYGLAKPLCIWLLGGASQIVRDNVSMLVGMCLFTVLNYWGQRFFTFASCSRHE